MAMLQSYDECECEGEDSQGINLMVLGQIAISAGALVVAIAVQGNSVTHFQCKSAVQKWIKKCGGCPDRDKPLSGMS